MDAVYTWTGRNGYYLLVADGDVFATVTRTGREWRAEVGADTSIACLTLGQAKEFCLGMLYTRVAHR